MGMVATSSSRSSRIRVTDLLLSTADMAAAGLEVGIAAMNCDTGKVRVTRQSGD